MICPRCKFDKEEFYESQADGWCVDCHIQAANEWRLRNPTKHLLADARRRSRTNRQAYNLTIEHLDAVWLGQEGRCAITQISFDLIDPPRPPSLQRIDPEQGFLCGNVQFVLPGLAGLRLKAENLASVG